MNSIDETIACLEIVKNYDIPIWVSFVLLDEKHILSGELLEDTIKKVEEFDVDVLLLNCNPINRTKIALKTIMPVIDEKLLDRFDNQLFCLPAFKQRIGLKNLEKWKEEQDLKEGIQAKKMDDWIFEDYEDN